MKDYKQDKRFLVAVKHLLVLEGGYVNDPSDRGGETKYGISKRQYPHLDIQFITEEQASEIYYNDYWLAYHCDKLPEAIGEFLFDCVVNHRPKTAIRFIQKTYRVDVDGILGPMTINAVRNDSSLVAIERHLVRCFSYRAVFYSELVENNPTQGRFLMGWFRRLFSLQKFINTEVLHVNN